MRNVPSGANRCGGTRRRAAKGATPVIRAGHSTTRTGRGSQTIVDKPDIVGNPDSVGGAEDEASARALVSLLFAPGQRPDAAAVEKLAAACEIFGISHSPAGDGPDGQPHWLELLTTGLTFDLHGLVPGASGKSFDFAHRYGLGADPENGVAESLTLSLGPHLEGAEGLLPVVRGAAGLVTALAALPGAIAIGWHPARALSSVAHFSSSVNGWLAGGAFPALGLTALGRSTDGAMTSEGLAHLIGHELRLEPAPGFEPADDARLAVRLIDRLVATGTVREAMTVEPVAGQRVTLEPDPGARLVRARRIAG